MGVTYFGLIFGIACLICYKNPGMLKPFMTEVYTKLCKLNRTQVQGYIDLHVNVVSLPGVFFIILLTSRAFSIEFVFSVFD